MSLQVWLPLNGNLKNQGLASGNIISSNVTYENIGKIGGKSLSGGTITLPATMVNTFYNKNHMSFAFWLYAKGTSGSSVMIGQSPMSAGNNRMYSIFQYSTPLDLHLSWQDETSNSTFLGGTWSGFFVENQWVHCTIVYNGTKALIYRNGVYYGSANGTSNRAVFNYDVSINGGSTRLLNDIRIYDHALSVKEVEELSKGLILHYKLDNNGFGQNNLLSRYVSPGQQAPGATATAGRTNYYGDYGIIIPAAENADTYFRLFLKEQLTQNEIYTISCNVSGLLNGSVYRFPLFAQGNISMGVLVLDHNGLCSLTFTMTYSTQTAVTINGETVYICFMDDSSRTIATNQGPIIITNFKIEKGSVATSWTPASTDRLYTSLGLNSNIIYDSSGYNNNGEIINNIGIEPNSPRYNSCIHMSATNQKIKISNFPTAGFGNSYTFAWWEKISSASPMHWGFADGIRLNGMYTGRLWNTGDSSNNPLYTPGTTTQVATPSTGVWHHWAMIGDGTTCKVYQDGVLWGQAKTYKAISGSTIYINGWDSGTSYCSDNASMSDFRIYCTALTAEQVKELYNVSASLSSNGILFAYEFNEMG